MFHYLVLTFTISTILVLLSILIVISSVTPVFLITVIPLGFLYRFIQTYYLASSRELQRLDAITKSPIYALFSETLNGLSTIRAYQKTNELSQETLQRITTNQRAYFYWLCNNRWLGIRIEFVGSCVVFFSALFSILQKDQLSAGMAALSLTYALKLTVGLTSMIRLTNDTENGLVAVERCVQYSELPVEAPEITNLRPPHDWPEKGQIVFDDLKLRYREGLPLVLKGISFKVKSKEKIGVVGRTGAGKSSLMLALFRLIEPASGKILIDGIDIAKLGLHDLRKNLSIIPQDPTLQEPYENFTDVEIESALEAVGLGSQLAKMEKGILHEVVENGENLSVGTRQLLCLARAVLKRSKILVLDEATASVDLNTDMMIQQTIRKEFKDVTVLTIAHRINTIIDSNRVLVLDNGQIAEFGTPEELLNDESSIFYSLAKEAGIINKQ
eukprot:TRINITY_DN1068_c0_g1_i38.p1 TRINITY_DN1068_c0_g1~~TRINITY_DN1068_c0_g1_i38.p1  ORF type:complete len:443 (+),score=95.74 TRINITY_DN1068_c0_g1_i38:3177-4505(+)